MKQKEQGRRRSRGAIYFLLGVVALHLLLMPFKAQAVTESLKQSGSLLLRFLPVLALVLLFMAITNYIASPKRVSRYVGKGSGFKGWVLAVSTGVLSHGPIYAWYPLLRDLRHHGMRSGLAATFLYNRAIKIPLLPLMVYYFGGPFVVVLLVFMVSASVVQGKIIELIDK